jgi:hypothetical protein
MNKRKALFEEILDNIEAYWRDYWTRKTSDTKFMRFGEFVVNNYLPSTILPWPELYYEINDKEAYELLKQRMKSLINQSANDVWSE